MIKRQGQTGLATGANENVRTANIGAVVPRPQRQNSTRTPAVPPSTNGKSPQSSPGGQPTSSGHSASSARPPSLDGAPGSIGSIQTEIDDANTVGIFDRLPSWVASAIVHTVLLVLLACLTLKPADLEKMVMIDSQDGHDDLAVEPMNLDASLELDSALSVETQTLPVDASMDLGEIDTESAVMDPLDVIKPTGSEYNNAALSKAFSAADAKRLAGQVNSKNGKKASFLGVEASGSKFVFVVDRSGSMGGARWMQARQELINSIRGLSETQEFFIVLYNHKASTMLGMLGDELQLVQANAENLDKVEQWLYRQTPGGNTSPRNAMRIAMDLEPDSIYLLSDGEFRDGTVEDLQKRNRHKKGERRGMVKTAVHCISFKSLSGAPTLQLIAQQNNGSYVFVQ